MAVPIWQTADFSPAPCLPCCGSTPTGCQCALLIGQSGPAAIPVPYASFSDAETAIADHVFDCIDYVDGGGDLPTTLTASFDGTTLLSNGTGSNSFPNLAMALIQWFSVSLEAGTLSIDYTNSGGGDIISNNVELRDCATGDLVASDSSNTGSGTFNLTVPTTGTYVLYFLGSTATLGTLFPTDITITLSVTNSGAFTVNPVIALWDDSGTTRQLDACPKLLLPPLTESSGDWYVDCAAAEDALSFVGASCTVYAKPTGNGSISSRSATSSGFTVTSDSAFEGGERYAVRYEAAVSMNLEAGTNAVQVTHSTTPYNINADPFTIRLIAEDGTTILADSTILYGIPSPYIQVFTFTLPAAGKYTLFVEVACEADNPTPISFSETLDVQFGETDGDIFTPVSVELFEAQALYDVGIDCSGRLNCGDSCV